MLYGTICALALASHAKTMFTDPGAIPQSAVPLAEVQQKVSVHAMCRYVWCVCLVCAMLVMRARVLHILFLPLLTVTVKPTSRRDHIIVAFAIDVYHTWITTVRG